MKPINDFSIRTMTEEDIPIVKSLIDKTLLHSYTQFYTPEVVDYFKELHSEKNLRKDLQQAYSVVLLQNNVILGTATLKGNECKRVYLDPDFHSRGLGKVLMKHIEMTATEKGIKNLILNANLGAKTFYDHLQYQVVSAKFIMVEEKARLDYYLMEKNLLP